MEQTDYSTTRVWKRTHKKLRIVAAYEAITIVELLDRLVDEAMQKKEIALPSTDKQKAARD